ncbi:MAG: helix-hairpin-helix domain-containing protein [Bradymonadaceae bacterium]
MISIDTDVEILGHVVDMRRFRDRYGAYKWMRHAISHAHTHDIDIEPNKIPPKYVRRPRYMAPVYVERLFDNTPSEAPGTCEFKHDLSKVDGVSETLRDRIYQHLSSQSIEKLSEAQLDDFQDVQGVGSTLAQRIDTWLVSQMLEL